MPRSRKEKVEKSPSEKPASSKKMNPWTQFVKNNYSKEKFGSLKNFLKDETMKAKYKASKK